MSASIWDWYGEAAKTAVGFFWKSSWAFVLGYTMSAMIRPFVPKAPLTKSMGDPDATSVVSPQSSGRRPRLVRLRFSWQLGTK